MSKYFPKATKQLRKIIIKQRKEDDIKLGIDWFSFKMKQELEKHLDRPGWKRESIEYLRVRLLEEVAELMAELRNKPDREIIVSEAADVANFAMMIADVYRVHKIKESPND